MNLAHPVVRKKIRAWQDELQRLTSKPILLMATVEPENKLLSYELVATVVCLTTGVTYEEVLDRSRKSAHALTRHLICYYTYNFTALNFQEIADKLRLDNHTSVMHANNRIKLIIDSGDARVFEIMNRINVSLNIEV